MYTDREPLAFVIGNCEGTDILLTTCHVPTPLTCISLAGNLCNGYKTGAEFSSSLPWKSFQHLVALARFIERLFSATEFELVSCQLTRMYNTRPMHTHQPQPIFQPPRLFLFTHSLSSHFSGRPMASTGSAGEPHRTQAVKHDEDIKHLCNTLIHLFQVQLLRIALFDLLLTLSVAFKEARR